MDKGGGFTVGALALTNVFIFCIASRVSSLDSHQELSTIPWSFFCFCVHRHGVVFLLLQDKLVRCG